jgi:hypothetical protein
MRCTLAYRFYEYPKKQDTKTQKERKRQRDKKNKERKKERKKN